MKNAVYLVTTKPDGPFYGMAKDHEARAMAYCDKWGIEYFHDCIENLDGFTKIDCAVRLFEGKGYRYVFLMDADSMVVDFSRDLRETIQEDSDHFIAMAPYPLASDKWLFHYQAGNIYLANNSSRNVVDFLNLVLGAKGKPSPHISDNEQSRINELMLETTDWASFMIPLSHHWNSIQHFAPGPDDIVASWHGAYDGNTRRQWMLAYAKAHPYPGQP